MVVILSLEELFSRATVAKAFKDAAETTIRFNETRFENGEDTANALRAAERPRHKG